MQGEVDQTDAAVVPEQVPLIIPTDNTALDQAEEDSGGWQCAPTCGFAQGLFFVFFVVLIFSLCYPRVFVLELVLLGLCCLATFPVSLLYLIASLLVIIYNNSNNIGYFLISIH